MRNLAQWEVIGRVGAIQPGNNVTHLRIAANYPYKDETTGEWVDNTYWNRVTVFRDYYRKQIADKLQIGDLVRAAGKMKDSQYEKNGETIYTTDREVDEFGILAHAPERGD